MIWVQCPSCKTMVSAPQGGQTIRCGNCEADVPVPSAPPQTAWQTRLSLWIAGHRPVVFAGAGGLIAALLLCGGLAVIVMSRPSPGKASKRYSRADLQQKAFGATSAEVSALLGEPEHVELVGHQPRAMSYEEYSNQLGLATLRGGGTFRWHYKNITRGSGTGGKDEWALLTIENDKVVRVDFVEVEK